LKIVSHQFLLHPLQTREPRTMNRRRTLAPPSIFEKYKKLTRRETLLAEMERVLPRKELNVWRSGYPSSRITPAVLFRISYKTLPLSIFFLKLRRARKSRYGHIVGDSYPQLVHFDLYKIRLATCSRSPN